MQDGCCLTVQRPAVAQMTTSVLLNYCQQCRQTAASSHAPVLASTAAAASEPTSAVHIIDMHVRTSSAHIQHPHIHSHSAGHYTGQPVLAGTPKNRRILSEQSFITHIPLLMATRVFRLGRRC